MALHKCWALLRLTITERTRLTDDDDRRRMNQAYSRLSTTHGHITYCKLLVCMYWTRLVPVRPAASLYSASPLKHHATGKQWCPNPDHYSDSEPATRSLTLQLSRSTTTQFESMTPWMYAYMRLRRIPQDKYRCTGQPHQYRFLRSGRENLDTRQYLEMGRDSLAGKIV